MDTNTQSDKIQTGDNIKNLSRNAWIHEGSNYIVVEIQELGHLKKLGASARQLRYSAALSIFPASYLLTLFSSMLFGGFPLLVAMDEALDVERIKKSSVPRPIVIPAAPVIRTFDLLPLGVKITPVAHRKEPSGMEDIKDEDVQIHETCFEDL